MIRTESSLTRFTYYKSQSKEGAGSTNQGYYQIGIHADAKSSGNGKEHHEEYIEDVTEVTERQNLKTHHNHSPIIALNIYLLNKFILLILILLTTILQGAHKVNQKSSCIEYH